MQVPDAKESVNAPSIRPSLVSLDICHKHALNGPRRKKTCIRGVRQSEFQTCLLSYRDYLEN